MLKQIQGSQGVAQAIALWKLFAPTLFPRRLTLLKPLEH